MEQGEYLGIQGSNSPLARQCVGCTEFSAVPRCSLSYAVFRGGGGLPDNHGLNV